LRRGGLWHSLQVHHHNVLEGALQPWLIRWFQFEAIGQLRPDTPLLHKAASYSPSCKYLGCKLLNKLLLKLQVLFRLQAALQSCKLLIKLQATLQGYKLHFKAASYSSSCKNSPGCKSLYKAASYSSRCKYPPGCKLLKKLQATLQGCKLFFKLQVLFRPQATLQGSKLLFKLQESSQESLTPQPLPYSQGSASPGLIIPGVPFLLFVHSQGFAPPCLLIPRGPPINPLLVHSKLLVQFIPEDHFPLFVHSQGSASPCLIGPRSPLHTSVFTLCVGRKLQLSGLFE